MKRKRFSEEQIVRILRAVEQSGKAVPEACREQGIAETMDCTPSSRPQGRGDLV
jgi:transposase-like protein